MPQYAVLIYTHDSAHDLEATREDLAEPDAHGDELAASGAMLVAYAFTPRALARSVRVEGVSRGPFVDAAEVVAGFYVIEADGWDEALAIAQTNPQSEAPAGSRCALSTVAGLSAAEGRGAPTSPIWWRPWFVAPPA